jgi:FkbH-like protein
MTTPPVGWAARKSRGLALLAGGNRSGLPVLKVAVLCSFNADSIAPFLVEALERVGFWCEPYLSPFGQMAQAVVDPGSALYEFGPDLAVLIPSAEDLLVPLFQRPGAVSEAEAARLVEERVAQVGSWVETLRSRRGAATVLAVAFGAGRLPGPHVLHPSAPERGQAAVERFVEGVRRTADLGPDVVVVDWDRAAAEEGWAGYRDERLWYLARMRLNLPGLARLSELIAGHVAAARGAARKVAVVDLDNTLWGGVVGEVGLQGLVLGPEGLGLAFQDFQRELLKWHDAGVLLAACSKNNPDDALAAIDGHPDGVLRREHFAGLKINWQDKATNIRELARELNLGLDSFVFLDDNPVERGWVASALPEVLVPELPADPVDRPGFLRAFTPVRRVALTETDRTRARSYQSAGVRERCRAEAASFDDYLGSLGQELEIAPLGPGSLARAAQMCQRTNQFNLTTRRYGPADLERLMADPDASVFTLSVRDRFEDSGMTGLAVLKRQGPRAEIDTLLLSCRVLGRRVEGAFLAFLARDARERGATVLVGRYAPTAKNGQVAGLYPGHGFQAVEEGVFALPLHDPGRLPGFPPQLTVKAQGSGGSLP